MKAWPKPGITRLSWIKCIARVHAPDVIESLIYPGEGASRLAGRGLGGALGQNQKLARTSWPGLFPCSDEAALLRTNNGLER